MHINAKNKVSGTAMCTVAAKMLLNKAFQLHREHAGSLLQVARLMQSMELTDKNDFGEGCHMASSEPFFYDSAYKLVKREYAFPIDTNGRCIIAKKVVCTSGEIPFNLYVLMPHPAPLINTNIACFLYYLAV